MGMPKWTWYGSSSTTEKINSTFLQICSTLQFTYTWRKEERNDVTWLLSLDHVVLHVGAKAAGSPVRVMVQCFNLVLPSLPSESELCLQDLEQYASSYSGLMRIERLQFIADHCPQLRVEALKMALSFVQRTFNVDVYEEIHRKLSEATRYWEHGRPAEPFLLKTSV